jgi:hypothetical protein
MFRSAPSVVYRKSVSRCRARGIGGQAIRESRARLCSARYPAVLRAFAPPGMPFRSILLQRPVIDIGLAGAEDSVLERDD